MLNWGTFDQRVWRLRAGGENTLLTGDIGSGKSTLVDAVTTLLLPAQRSPTTRPPAPTRRSARCAATSQGHYKSERVEATGTSRPVGLRDHSTYSVVLGVFTNDGYDAHGHPRPGVPPRASDAASPTASTSPPTAS